MTTQITTPVGRLVQGHPMEMQDKDQQGNLRVVKSGPNMGQPSPQVFIALAISKQDPAWPAIDAALKAEARAGFPHMFDAAGNCTNPKFSFKVSDGDGVDDNGKPNNTKEGFAGHWVLKCSSGYLPKCFHAGRYSAMDQIQDKMAIRRGDYLRVQISISPNGNTQRPGVYVNLNLVELSGKGVEIVSGPDAGAAFGSGPGQLPPGASPTPMMVPGSAGQPPAPTVAPVAAPVTPAPVAAPTAPAAPPVPNTTFLKPFPPEGWMAHPDAAGYWYKGNEVLTEEQLRAL